MAPLLTAKLGHLRPSSPRVCGRKFTHVKRRNVGGGPMGRVCWTKAIRRSDEVDEVKSVPPRSPQSSKRSFADPAYATELLDELLDTSKLGTRGEGWVLAQVILLLLLVFPTSGLRQLVDVAGWCLVLTGFAFITAGSLDLGSNLTPLPKPRDEHSLVTDGVYQLCRHPLYGGIILGATGLGVATGDEARLAVAALLFLVLNYKSSYEEEFLEDRYPTQYPQYKAKTKKLIPFIF